MASRVLGLLRETVFSGLFGSSKWTDCYVLAFKVPNLLRDLFAEGALSQAFVTTFSKTLKSEGEASAWALANKVLTLAAIFMSLITLIGIGIAPWIVDFLTLAARRDIQPEEIAFTITLVRLMYPFILLVSLAALVMGMLNAKDVFVVPALSSCYFNLGSIIGGVALGWWIDPTWGAGSLVGFSIGVVIGGAAQLFSQFPSLWKVGYRYAIDFQWRDSRVRKVLNLMLPAVIAASVVQVNVMVNAMFAYGIAEGAASWLNYAFRLMQLPIGLFGVAVATVTLPAMARAAVGGIGDDFQPVLTSGLRMVAFLVLPSTIGIMLLAHPLVSVFFERGRFTVFDRQQTAIALQAYSVGLLFYAWLKVLQPAFYAIDKRWFPMMTAILALFVNLGFNYLFVFVLRLGHEFLALTSSITASLNFVLLYLAMNKLSGGLQSASFFKLLGKLALAGVGLAGICAFALHRFLADPGSIVLPLRIAYLGATIAVAAGVYFLICWILRVEEIRDAITLVRRRIGR